MKKSFPQISPLPMINLRKFDELQRQFVDKALTVGFEFTAKKVLKKAGPITHVLNDQIEKIYRGEQLRTLKSLKMMQESKLKVQYRSKSVHFFKSLLANKTISSIQENMNKKVIIRSISQKTIWFDIPKPFASKSLQKIKSQKQTMYESWVPNKVAVREAQKLPQITKEKMKQLQNSFFNRCRSKHSILKLSRNQ